MSMPAKAPATSHSANTFVAQRADGAPDVLSLIAKYQDTSTAFAFQRLAWLKPLYETLAADLEAEPLAICVTDADSGELAALLPLLVTRRKRLAVVSWASLGVSDYGAPVLGPKAPVDSRGYEALWEATKRALDGFDLWHMSNTPETIEGRPNPFALSRSRIQSHHSRNAMALPGTVEEFLASRGKKYRKEAERCTRLLIEKGTPEFRRAETPDAIAAAYATLEAQQLDRHRARGSVYRLDETAFSRFYEVALREGTPQHSAHIFTLSAGGETGAVLYGISNGTAFTLLRISTAGEAWKRLSPGRLIVLETMRYFMARGITTFDMGIGDYEFKHGFGISSEPLFEVTTALSLRGLPKLMQTRAKSKLRQHPGLVAAVKRVLRRRT